MPKLGGLDVRVVGGTGEPGPVVVLCHGYGAPGDDLVPLARVLDVPANVRFVFPAAPLRLPMPFMEARAWWHIDLERLERALETGDDGDFRRDEPAGLGEARAAISKLLRELEATKVVLGGFSQGAMLSLDVALRDDFDVKGLVLMSGTLLAEEIWAPLVPRRKGLPVFQSHGTRDPLLPYRVAERLRDLLKESGLEVDWHAFPGGHEIPMPVLDRLSGWLGRVLAG